MKLDLKEKKVKRMRLQVNNEFQQVKNKSLNDEMFTFSVRGG